MDEMYVKIGDFNIRIDLVSNHLDIKASFAKTRSEIDLLIYLRSFLIHIKPAKIDFEIQLKEASEELISIPKSGKTYLPLFQKISNKKIITYYQNNINQFEIVLKNALLLLLKQNGGFGIHASVANVDDHAYLFLGESGAGKSTSVELLKEKYPTINDDITLIKKIGKKYYVFQTPFIEKAWWIKKTQKLYPVDKIYFLHQSTDFKAEPKANSQKLTAKLLEQVIAAQKPDEKILKNVKDFIKSMNNFYDLYFAKDSSKLIDLVAHIK